MNLTLLISVSRRHEPPFMNARLLAKLAPCELWSAMKPLPSVCFWASMFSNDTLPSITPAGEAYRVTPLDQDWIVLLPLWAEMLCLSDTPGALKNVKPVRPFMSPIQF